MLTARKNRQDFLSSPTLGDSVVSSSLLLKRGHTALAPSTLYNLLDCSGPFRAIITRERQPSPAPYRQLLQAYQYQGML